MNAWLRSGIWLAMVLLLSAAAARSNAQTAGQAAENTPADLGWAVQISAGTGYTCTIAVDGSVFCWGSNYAGELGDGTTRDRAAPVEVVGLFERVVTLSAGGSHTCAVLQSGGVKCWGRNGDGQLGDGTRIDHSTPVEAQGLTGGVRAVSAGDKHTCALMANGGVKCWGNNDQGQLGDGATDTHLTPVNVPGLASGVRALSAGAAHTCTVTETGGVQCWGANRHGQLGDGTQVDRWLPTSVIGLNDDVQTVSAGDAHTCVVTNAGGAKCWGGNVGLLGDGTVDSRLIPVDVVGISTGAQTISAARYHTCALTVSGGAKCWGGNTYGQLGNGRTDWYSLTPVDVIGLTSGVGAIDVGSGGGHSCVVTVTGDAKCWGANWAGQLGDGTTLTRLTPVEVWNPDYDCTAVNEIPAAECQALVTFFKTTNGPLWQQHAGWLRTTTPCSWYGVACAAGHVSALDLPANHLVDTLPAAVGDLAALQRLDLHGNDLEGPLPEALGNLSALQYLDLSGNRFSGFLPATLGNLKALQHLDLSANGFNGSLPEKLGQLTALRYLSLRANNLGGRLPKDLGSLVALEHLDLSLNQLTDNLNWSGSEQTLSQLHALRYLDLSYNHLTGPLPWWPDLTALEHLDLSHNTFMGVLPWDVVRLTHLTYLALHTNHLSGLIPPTWGQLGAQRVFTPTGTTPPPGVYIDLSGNHLYGTIPTDLGQNPALQGLQLAGNALSGPVPAAVTDHVYYFLDLNYNQLVAEPGRTPAWAAMQTVAPTQLRVEETATGRRLAWTPIPYWGSFFDEEAYYEISYAPAPAGPFSVYARTESTGFDAYPLTDLAPGAYYFRLRTFTAAHSFYVNDYYLLPVFNQHEYLQPNNLWSDYTPLVSVNVAATSRVFLPLVGRGANH